MAIPAWKSKLDRREKNSIINDVAIAAAQSIELDTVLKTALEKVMEAFKVNNGGIYLVDFKTDRLILKTFRGLTPAFVAEKSDVSQGQGCAGWAVEHNEYFSAHGHPEANFICEDAERLMGIDCLVACPISTKRRVHGVIELFAPSSRRLTKDEADLIGLISNQIGIAVENARLYEESRDNVIKLTELKQELAITNKRLKTHLSQESHIAEILQKSLLPRHIPQIDGLQISARLVSATESTDVGGDFYDFMKISNGHLALVVGDVCGSGIEASTLTSMAKNTVRAFLLEEANVARVMTRTNRVVYAQTDPSKFVALFIALFDLNSWRLEYCTAGQPSPFLTGADGQIAELHAGNTALGVDKDADYRPYSLDFKEGDTLLTFTDGLIEARRGPTLFGEERIKKILAGKINLPLDGLVDTILNAAKDFAGGNLRDDVALVSIRRQESARESEM